jgi:hypothetical protein
MLWLELYAVEGAVIFMDAGGKASVTVMTFSISRIFTDFSCLP